MNLTNKPTSALLGLATGDALGVPYEFRSRDQMDRDPCTTMTGYGTYNQPPGTWSDDTSLTLCLADSLKEGYDLADMARKFIAWRDEGLWSARGEVFDIGGTTSASIYQLKQILESGRHEQLEERTRVNHERENGNGSLMRILPLLFYIKGETIATQWEKVREVSALTHRHMRAHMSCLIYLRVGEHILKGSSPKEAYGSMRAEIRDFWEKINYPEEEQEELSGVIVRDISERKRHEISSKGYVVASLEAALWCLLTTEDYPSAVLKAVNLGTDTDTIAAITGGLAGMVYGLDGIPADWLDQLARRTEIQDLATLIENT